MSRARDNRVASAAGRSWKRLLLLSAFCVGCAHAASAKLAQTAPRATQPEQRANSSSERPATPSENRNPSADDIVQILSQSGLRFATLDPGHRWQVSFAGHDHRADVLIDVIYTDTFTVVLGKLFTLPAGADTDIYKAIAERNFELEQMKLSVDQTGSVFASFEVPTRIIDRRELLENIASLAAALDSLHMDETPNHPPSQGPARPHLSPAGPGGAPPGVETIDAPAPRPAGSSDTIL
jgi:hypothetical protein